MKNPHQATGLGFHGNASALQHSTKSCRLTAVQAAGPALPGRQWPIPVTPASPPAARAVVPSALWKGRCLSAPPILILARPQLPAVPMCQHGHPS